ncbi:MAG: transposase zinc-binding domain-containing protein [Deltaproteobacteria bacterium]|nr:transposase zinc-binding domain-containing protein [Deltaproteobacteria bacterium]
MPAIACALSTSARPAKRPYARRQPDKTVLYELVREHLESFLEEGRRRSAHGEGYPAYVERTFRSFLTCGVMACGCAKLRCAECGHEMFVAVRGVLMQG